MKVIELLNKIANREEVPTTIKYQDNYYNFIRKYNEDWEEYELGYKNLNGGYLNIWRDNVLNDEVEIIEEKEMCHKCHKYPVEYNQTYCEFCLGISKLEEHKIPEKLPKSVTNNICNSKDIRLIANTLNEIIDYLEEENGN